MQSFINKVKEIGSAEQSGISQKDMNNLLENLMGEIDAIINYNQSLEETQNEDIKRVLIDIRNEEQMHIGQIMDLVFRDSNFKKNFNKGIEENRVTEK